MRQIQEVHMKFKTTKLIGALALVSCAAIGFTGCGDSTSKPEAKSPSGKNPSAVALAPGFAPPIVPTDIDHFDDVMSLLDEGGSILLYVGTKQLYAKLDEQTLALRELLKTAQKQSGLLDSGLNVEQFMDGFEAALKRSGLAEVTGFGLSGTEIESGMHRSRFVLHHESGAGDGYFWDFFGSEAHEPYGLNLMPANTVLGSSQDLDLGKVWQVITNETAAIGGAEASAGLNEFRKQFKTGSGLDLDAVLGSFASQFGVALTLDDKEKITIPDEDVQIPRPDLMLFARVKGRLLFDHLSNFAKAMPGTVITNVNGIDQVQLGPMYPGVPSLRPVLAQVDDQLLLCSSPEMLKAALDVKSGTKPGLAESERFKKLSGMATPQGNGFAYVDRRLNGISLDLQKKAMADLPAEAADFRKLLEKLSQPSEGYGVFENTDQGWVWTGIGNHDSAGVFLATAVAVPAGIVAGIALPSFSQGRSSAQRIKCVNNLKQVSLGLKIDATTNDDRYPFQRQASDNGSMAQAKQDRWGDDRQPFLHLLRIKNELRRPSILTCPAIPGVKPVKQWEELTAQHISYKLRTGKEVDETNPEEAMIWCPIHHNVALVSGQVLQLSAKDTAARTAGSWKPQSAQRTSDKH